MVLKARVKKAMGISVFALLVLGVSFSCKQKVEYPGKSNANEIWREESKKEGEGARQEKSVSITAANSIFVELAKKLNPAVVNVTTTYRRKGGIHPFEGERDEFFKKFFEEFFGAPFSPPVPPEYRQKSLGSGFIINEEGHILTNNHVVEDAEKIEVVLEGEKDGKKFDAKVIGRDKNTDIALIKIESKTPLPYAPLGDSDRIQVGEWVIAIGNPFGYGHTVSAGIVSAKERILGMELKTPYNDYIQTDAAIHPGNSGGPLINIDGEVVGMNTAIDVRGAGLGFAIPINTAKRLLPQLKEKGRIVRGWMGVGIDDVTEEIAEQLRVPKDQKGALITQVFAGDPADKAGIQPYDIIVRFGKDAVKGARDLQLAVGQTKVGDKIEIEILRDGKKVVKTLVVSERKEEEPEALGASKELQEKIGMEVGDLNAERREKFGIEKGKTGVVILNVAPYSPSYEAGLRAGQLILEISRKRIKNLSDYEREIKRAKAGSKLLFRVQAGEAIFVTSLTMPGEK